MTERPSTPATPRSTIKTSGHDERAEASPAVPSALQSTSKPRSTSSAVTSSAVSSSSSISKIFVMSDLPMAGNARAPLVVAPIRRIAAVNLMAAAAAIIYPLYWACLRAATPLSQLHLCDRARTVGTTLRDHKIAALGLVLAAPDLAAL